MKLLRWKFRLFPLLVFLVPRTRFLSRLKFRDQLIMQVRVPVKVDSASYRPYL